MLTRRQFCSTMAFGSLALSPLAAAMARLLEGTRLEIIPLREGFNAIIGEGGNSMMVQSDRGLLLVDCKQPYTGPALLRIVQEHTGGPPRIVINTHHHADHTGGNLSFRRTSHIIAHTNAFARIQGQLDTYRERIQRMLDDQSISEVLRRDALLARQHIDFYGASAFTPHRRITPAQRDRVELGLGDMRYSLRRFGNGHTDNDLVVHFPAENVVHTGDLVFNGIHPYMDVPAGAESVGWQSALRSVIELCDSDTIVVPGHGPITDVSALETQIAYFDLLRDTARSAIAGGLSRNETSQKQIESLADLEWPAMLERNLGIMYDELKAEGA